MANRTISREAYYRALYSGLLTSVRLRVGHFLWGNPQRRGWTRNEIAEATDIRLATICKAVHTLIASGILKEGVYQNGSFLKDGKRADRWTTYEAHPVHFIPGMQDLLQRTFKLDV